MINHDPSTHSSYRWVGNIKRGYHVQAGDAWLLVEAVERVNGSILLVFTGGTAEMTKDDHVWSRTPAEQVYAVSAALPSINNVEQNLGEPLANPFNGSAPTPITEMWT